MSPIRASSRIRAAGAVALLVAILVGAPAYAVVSSLERATSSVVAITAGADRIGTGVVVGTDRVLTVSHVVDAAEGLAARILVDNRLLTYEVVAIDRDRDLALLAADIPDDVPAIVWGDSTALERGEDVIALGFPIGLSSVSLTKGVVSSPLQTYEGVEFVQTDAAINPGNSGGPLVDGQGRLVGINVAKIALVEVDAVGFSVPAKDALDFLKRAAPDLELLVDLSSGETPAEVDEQPSGTGIEGATIAILAAATLVGVGAVIAVRMALVRAVERRAAEAGADIAEVIVPERSVDRAVFRASAPGDEREFDLRLPCVAGSAANADIPVRGAGTNAYQVRFTVAPEGVLATNLADAEGMYCGDECVATAVLRPGMSVLVGMTTITYVRSYRA